MFSAEEVQILLLSLRVAFCCVLLSLLPAVLLGWLLARREFPLKIALDGLCHLPLVLPPVVTGYLLLLLLAAAVSSAQCSPRSTSSWPSTGRARYWPRPWSAFP